ncbi:MAG TPA: DUF4203 domain-containing protein [Candidatus Saccharimonadales bacterium]|jgi:Domain of unknown function (DUF4203)|nr:DUF4203 domain-containing protein [Candidatus Saccharimonadales bacterium]
MDWLDILIGIALLLFGRKLFWLFVGGVGFVVGFQIAMDTLHDQPQWVIFLIALGAGLLGIILSIFLQRIVVGVAGFFAGGYFLSNLAMALLHANDEVVQWITFIAGGLLGAILTVYLLNPALIILSSLAGATAVAQSVPLEPAAKGILFIVLAIFGIIVQTREYVSAGKAPKRADSSTQ